MQRKTYKKLEDSEGVGDTGRLHSTTGDYAESEEDTQALWAAVGVWTALALLGSAAVAHFEVLPYMDEVPPLRSYSY